MANDENGAAPGSRSDPGAAFLPRLPRLIGHRGAKAVAPENTLAAFERAAADGAGWVEFDVRLCADGVPIVFHDDILDRTTNGTGPVVDHDLAALKKLDAGSWFGPSFAGATIPTLSEAMEVCAAHDLGMNIEIKPNHGQARETALATLEMVEARARGLRGRVVFSSFQVAALRTLLEGGPRWPRGLLLRALRPGWYSDAEQLACQSLHLRSDCLVDPGLVAALRAQGFRVLSFTVNEPERATDLFGWGVESVITDDPGRLSVALQTPL